MKICTTCGTDNEASQDSCAVCATPLFASAVAAPQEATPPSPVETTSPTSESAINPSDVGGGLDSLARAKALHMGQTSDQAPDAARDEVVVETLGDDLFIERADDDIISEDELPSVDVIPINPPAGAAERKSIVADLLEKSIAEDSVIKRLPPALAPLTLDAPKETDAPQPSDPTRGKLKKKLFLLSIAGIVGLTLVLGVILALIFFK